MERLHEFCQWLKLQPHKYKVVIPGNHDLEVEASPLTARAMMLGPGIHFLINEGVTLDGVKFWGSPVTPWFHDWAWNVHRGGDIAKVWARIPEDTDVLVTHGPPYGILDEVIYGGKSVGCEELRKRVLAVQPKVHIFGHIHESNGYFCEGPTQYVNAACLNFNGTMNPPHVVDIDVPNKETETAPEEGP